MTTLTPDHIRAHIDQIIATPWRNHPEADRPRLRREELALYTAKLAERGLHTDPDIMRALADARTRLG